MRADLVGINNLITQGNSKNCMNGHTNQGHYPVGSWTQFCKMLKLNAKSLSSQVVTSVRFNAVPREQQELAQRALRNNFSGIVSQTYNQKNIEALHFVLQVVGYIVNANNDPTGYNY